MKARVSFGVIAASLLCGACSRPHDDADILPPPGYVEPPMPAASKQPPRAKRVHFGAGFYEREVAPDGTSWRWMSARGITSLPSLGRAGHLTLRARAQLARPDAKPTLTIRAGANVLETRNLDSKPFTVDLDIDERAFAGQPVLDLELAVSETVIVPGDSRPLGIAVESVAWEPAR